MIRNVPMGFGVTPLEYRHCRNEWPCLKFRQNRGSNGVAQFAPLEETYGILAKFEVVASEEEQNMLAELGQAGEDFKDMLKEVEQVSSAHVIHLYSLFV